MMEPIRVPKMPVRSEAVRESSIAGFVVSILLVTALSAGACRVPDIDGAAVPDRRNSSVSESAAQQSETVLVRSHGSHRVRIERVCGPEHCATLGYLETLAGEFPRRVEYSVEIEELAEKWWSYVEDVEIFEREGGYCFDLHAVDTHGTEASFTLRVTPGPGTGYRAEFRDVVSIAEPE